MDFAKIAITKQEATLLLHHYRTELARWSDDEPDLKDEAQRGVDYWAHALAERFTVTTEFDRHFPDVSGPPPA